MQIKTPKHLAYKQFHQAYARTFPPLQDLLELLLLLRSQGCRVLDLDADDEVTSLSGRLALRHTLPREAFFECGLRGSL